MGKERFIFSAITVYADGCYLVITSMIHLLTRKSIPVEADLLNSNFTTAAAILGKLNRESLVQMSRYCILIANEMQIWLYICCLVLLQSMNSKIGSHNLTMS